MPRPLAPSMSPKGSMKTALLSPTSANADWPYHLTFTGSPRLRRLAGEAEVANLLLNTSLTAPIGAPQRGSDAGKDAHRDANHQRDPNPFHERLCQQACEEVRIADSGRDRRREIGERRGWNEVRDGVVTQHGGEDRRAGWEGRDSVRERRREAGLARAALE